MYLTDKSETKCNKTCTFIQIKKQNGRLPYIILNNFTITILVIEKSHSERAHLLIKVNPKLFTKPVIML